MKSLLRKVLAGAAVLAVAAPALASHSWNGYHWAHTSSSGTLKLKLNAAITSVWGAGGNSTFNQMSFGSGALGTAVKDWDASTVLDLASAPSSADRKRCNPISGQVLVCNYTYGYRGWLGIAQIWLSGDHITKGTVKLNDSYYSSPTYNTDPWRQLVMCQEIGHTFGLAHQDENFDNANLDTCMDYTSRPESNQHPNQHDYDQLVSIYSHFDTTNTSSTQTTNFGLRDFTRPALPVAAQGAGGGDGPEAWGVAIHSDGGGRPDVFEKQLGGGQKMVTHVFWALETGAPS